MGRLRSFSAAFVCWFALSASAQERRDRERSPDFQQKLTAGEVNDDLDTLKDGLRHRYSYLELRDVPWERRLDELRDAARSGGMTTGELAIELQQLLAQFGDGHTRVRQLSSYVRREYLPISGLGWREHVLALDQTGRLLDPAFPALRGIDDLPLARWLEEADRLAPRGSESFRRARAIENLALLGWLRQRLGRGDAKDVKLELSSLDGGQKKQITLPTENRTVRSASRKFGKSRMLGEDIGYLRIDSMDDDSKFLADIRRRMHDFHTCRGLIVDVRGNGGGSRAPLRTLAPFFFAADDPPYVANVAAYRRQSNEPRDKPDGYLQDRWLYPAAWPEWSAEARAAISKVAANFRPQWNPPAAQFSDWHYFVLERSASPDFASFAGKVIVLMDGECFSATDIFLGALKGRRNITLMGTTSGGGSGRARSLRLPASGIEVLLSSMASFRPDGRLYDAQGIEPDVVAEPTLKDLLGETDSQLDAAIAALK